MDEGGKVTVNTLGSVLLPRLIFILQTIFLCICEPKFLVVFSPVESLESPPGKEK